jgi:hypothetical protein
LREYFGFVASNFRANPRKFVAKKIAPAHFRNLNFQNLSKPIYFRQLLIKTTPESFKTIPKLYYFLTLFIRIFFFLRFCAVASSSSNIQNSIPTNRDKIYRISALTQRIFALNHRTYATHFRADSAHLEAGNWKLVGARGFS